MSIGQNIKKIRKDNNLTQKQFAEKINKKEITVRRYEKGDITPPMNVIKEISQIFNISTSKIIENDTSAFPPDTTESINELLEVFGEDDELSQELGSERIKVNDSINILLEQVGSSAKDFSAAEFEQLKKSLIEYLKTIAYIKES